LIITVYGDNAWVDLIFLVALDRIPNIATTFNSAPTNHGMYDDLPSDYISMHHALIHLLLVKVNALT
jgi:predicted protein tyrosine phosphatase